MAPSHPPVSSTATHTSWGPPPRGVFVDLLGTLVRLDESGNVPEFSADIFYDGVLDALFQVTQAGWHLYLVGNIEPVAQGRQSEAEWRAFSDAMKAFMKSQGIKLRRDYTCIDDPEGAPGRNKDSVYFLPGTGAMHHAAQADGVSLQLSWVVGDSSLELVAGWRAGCRLAGVRTGQALKDGHFHVDPEFTAADANTAIRAISRDTTLLRRAA